MAANTSTILNATENITLGIEKLLNETQLYDSSEILISWIQSTPGDESIIEGYVTPFKGSQQNAESTFSNALLSGGVPGILYKVSSIKVGNSVASGSSPGFNDSMSSNQTRPNISKIPFQGPYINFTEPTGTSNSSTSSSLGDQWAYLSYNYSTSFTTGEIFNIDHSQPDRVNSTSFEVNGSYSLIAHSRTCLIIKDFMGTALIFREDSASQSYVQDPFELSNVIDLNRTFGSNGTNGTNSSLWQVSDSCDRIRFGDSFYFRNVSGAFSPMNNPVTFSSYHADKNLDYAIGIDGNLYKYNTNQNAFELFFTPPSPLPSYSSTSINVFNDRLVINATDSNIVEIYAYQIQGNSLTLVLNFTDDKFLIDPEVAVSPQLTKVLIAGNGIIAPAQSNSSNSSNSTNGTNGPITHGFNIDWTTKNVENITLPSSTLRFGADYILTLG